MFIRSSSHRLSADVSVLPIGRVERSPEVIGHWNIVPILSEKGTRCRMSRPTDLLIDMLSHLMGSHLIDALAHTTRHSLTHSLTHQSGFARPGSPPHAVGTRQHGNRFLIDRPET